jgi:hypothetical protein
MERKQRLSGGATDQTFLDGFEQFDRAQAQREARRRARASQRTPANMRLEGEKSRKLAKRGQINKNWISTGSSTCPEAVGNDTNQQFFSKTDQYGWNAAQRRAPSKNYHKVKDPRDGVFKGLKTTDGNYCVRGAATRRMERKAVEAKTKTLLANLEEFSKILGGAMRDNARKVKQAREVRDAAQIKRLSKNIAGQRQYGTDFYFQPQEETVCDPYQTIEQKMWQAEVGTPNERKISFDRDMTDYEKGTNNFAAGWLSADGYCASDGSNRISDTRDARYQIMYHGRDDLRRVPDKDKPQLREGVPEPDAKIYHEAAFCAGQQTKQMCNSGEEAPLPNSKSRAAPNSLCAWYEDPTGADSSCRPTKIENDRIASDSTGPIDPENAYAQWYEAFRKADQDIINARGITRSAVPGMTRGQNTNMRFPSETMAQQDFKLQVASLGNATGASMAAGGRRRR